MAGIGKAIYNAVVGGLGSISGAVVGWATDAINAAIRLINKAIDVYNKIPLAPNIPKIPEVGGGGGGSRPPTTPGGGGDRRGGAGTFGNEGTVGVLGGVQAPPPVVIGTPRDFLNMASGGIVKARPGIGTLARIGEGRHDEAVIPLRSGRLGGRAIVINFHGPVYGGREGVRELTQEIVREIQRTDARNA
jgi:hypothetical protein